MTGIDLAELAALAGALGAVFVLVPRGVILPLAGFALLCLGIAGLGRSLVDERTLELLVTEPLGLTLLAVLAVGWAPGEDASPRAPRSIAVLPFRNETSEHIDSALSSLSSDIETKLVNAGHGPTIRDGVDSASRPATTTFPYLAAANPDPPEPPEHH